MQLSWVAHLNVQPLLQPMNSAECTLWHALVCKCFFHHWGYQQLPCMHISLCLASSIEALSFWTISSRLMLSSRPMDCCMSVSLVLPWTRWSCALIKQYVHLTVAWSHLLVFSSTRAHAFVSNICIDMSATLIVQTLHLVVSSWLILRSRAVDCCMSTNQATYT